MKVLLLSGTYPPEPCGIGDYTEKLSNALKKNNIEVSVIGNINWSIRNYLKIRKEILKAKADVIHIQYPSVGYGTSLVPQLISLNFKTVVTIHEVLQAHIVRKLSLLPFLVRSKLIFTNEYERSSCYNIYPWRRVVGKDTIIPIGSNIIGDTNKPLQKRDLNTIVHFGLIRPNKGLEDVMELAQALKKNGLRYRILVVGQLRAKFKSYHEDLANAAAGMVDWAINLNESEVSRILSDNLIAYMPFPDGASERRGSLLAALSNNMFVFSTIGKYTPQVLQDIVMPAGTPLDVVMYLKENDSERLMNEYETRVKLMKDYLKKLDWNSIAKCHIDFYNK